MPSRPAPRMRERLLEKPEESGKNVSSIHERILFDFGCTKIKQNPFMNTS